MESLTTSAFPMVATTRFWLTGATAVQVPSGETGDRSMPVNSARQTRSAARSSPSGIWLL
ncbi:MAG TPA: hypothetical protein VKU77_05350 [Streptosporangiaceae bacterium]|nr:hypothetical protein [Streptosporangiaceae bacterium]